MFEMTLEDLISKTIKSLTPDMAETLINCMKQEQNIDSFDKAYNIVETFLKTDHFKFVFNELPEKTYESIFYKLKPIAALYCCYFGMDYVMRQENPNGVPLNTNFLTSYYDISVDSVQYIMKLIRRQKENIKNTWEYPDPSFINPYIDCKYAENKKYQPYIYNGNIINYLKKSYCITDNSPKEYSIRDLVPAITLIALRSTGSLPNGGNTNKSTHISANTINSIDQAIGEIYNINGKEVPAVNTKKISYKTDEAIAELINLAALDDVYKLERLEKALCNYSDYIRKYKNTTFIQDKAFAGICSLFMNLPLPFIETFDFDKELNSIINNEYIKPESLVHIIGFFTTVFPYTIGLLCFLLYSQHNIAVLSKLPDVWLILHKLQQIYYDLNHEFLIPINNELKEIENSLAIRPLEEVRTTVTNLENFSNKNYLRMRQNMRMKKSEKIWSYNTAEKQNSLTKCIYEDKGNGRTNKHLEWRYCRNLSFNDVMDIILNQKNNIANIRNPIEENYARHAMCEFLVFNSVDYPGILRSYFLNDDVKDTRKITPEEYVDLLSKAFIYNL